ncbi:SMI1/KNR4 family protein [Kitasatospora sp. NPDC088391]|uniref:SMI1/KNR4 family protein n=1 Tax=Kitasatospora sp. NPDC088391 TaxID=3364074 RepID=UPI003805313B
MALADPGRLRFGAAHHGYRLRERLGEGTIRAFELLHGVALPASYRSFLSTVADGGAGPHHGLLGLAEDVDEEEALHDVRAECLRPGFLARVFVPAAERSMEGTLVLGEVGCGTFSHLVVTGPDAGRVWYDDQVWGARTPGPDFRDWYTAWLAAG